MKALLLVLTLTSIQLFSQNNTDIFKQYIETKKNQKEYQVNINYAIYKGMKGTKAYESYDGVEAKLNDNFYQKLHNTELIMGADFMVKLNPDEKAMLVGYASQPVLTNFNQLDISKVLEFFKEYTVTEKDNYWKVVLTKPNYTLLAQFKIIELHIEKETLRLQKQIMYYGSLADFAQYEKNKTTKDLDVPRLEITYENYQNEINLNKNILNSSNYFLYENNTITTAPKYKGYQIIYPN